MFSYIYIFFFNSTHAFLDDAALMEHLYLFCLYFSLPRAFSIMSLHLSFGLLPFPFQFTSIFHILITTYSLFSCSNIFSLPSITYLRHAALISSLLIFSIHLIAIIHLNISVHSSIYSITRLFLCFFCCSSLLQTGYIYAMTRCKSW